jgi:hypothetical protein
MILKIFNYTILPVSATSQHLTLQSQLPASKKFFGKDVAGENFIADIVSSGGAVTSISFIGFD